MAGSSSEIVVCPFCKGIGISLTTTSGDGYGIAQKVDPVCQWCAGTGRVSRQDCACGRPMIWLFGRFGCCFTRECIKNAIEATIKEAKEKQGAAAADTVHDTSVSDTGVSMCEEGCY